MNQGGGNSSKLRDYEISLTDLFPGREIQTVTGLISYEFGEIGFELSRILFTDGTFVWCEGEHDHPYITFPRGEGESTARRLRELDTG